MIYGSFDVRPVDRSADVGAMADRLAAELLEQARSTPGLLKARVHVSVDGSAVVVHGQWATADGHERLLRALPPDSPLRQSAGISFHGARLARIEGPAVTDPPGLASVAIRHVPAREAARSLADLLVETGTWKRHSVGFISATAYVSEDGRTYVNYPQWVGDAAYRAYMDDPRLAGYGSSIADLETGPPEFILCTLTAEIGKDG